MKYYKKKYYGLLLVILSFILFVPFSVKAQTFLTYNVPSNWCNNGGGTCSFTANETKSISLNNFGNGYGIGKLLFTYYQSGTGAIYEITVSTTNNKLTQCSLTSSDGYLDNTNQFSIGTAVCDVDLTNGGVNYIYIHNKEVGYLDGFLISNRINFFQSDMYDLISAINSQNYNGLLSTISSTLIDIKSRNNEQLADLYTNLTNVKTVLEQYKARTNEQLVDIYTAISNQISAIEDTTSAVEDNTQAINDVNDSINDSTIDSSSASGFFNNFQDNNHGLSSIITAPLNFIRNLANSTCSPISLTIPFVNQSFNFPCMSTIYRQNFNSLFTLYQTIIFGIVAYYVCVRIYTLVKGFKNPDDDRIEVVEL